MAFEDFLVTLRDDHLGKLGGEEPLQPPDPPQLFNLFRDPRLQTTVQLRHLVGALAQFAQKPRVLHRNDRLRRKVLQQRDLLVGKRPYHPAIHEDCPQYRAFVVQCHRQPGSDSPSINPLPGRRIVSIFFCFPDVSDVNNTFATRDRLISAARRDRAEWPYLLKSSGISMHRDEVKQLAVKCTERSLSGITQRYRLFYDLFEHRLEVARRGIDDLQYLGSRSLLLQRLLRLGQQPRILHRNDRLRREILEQRDFLSGELAHLAAVHDDCPEQRVFFAQGDGCRRANTADVHKLLDAQECAVGFCLCSIGNLCDALALHYAAQRAGVRTATNRSDGAEPPPPLRKTCLALDCGGVELLAIECINVPVVRLTQPHRLFQHGVKHRREIARRGVDDAQHLGNGGLLLTRFRKFSLTLGKLTLQIGYQLLGIG